MIELNHGQILYKYAFEGSNCLIISYTVVGFAKLNLVKKYVVKCNSCKHGDACQVLLAVNDSGEIKFDSMFNIQKPYHQYYHETDGGISYCLTKNEARLQINMEELAKTNHKIKHLEKEKSIIIANIAKIEEMMKDD